MNITTGQESIRFNQDLYKTLTPTRKRTFSENMTRRRIPFLHSENKENISANSIIKFKKPNVRHEQHSLKTRYPLVNQDNEKNSESKGIVTQRKTNFNTELETENWLKLKEDIRKIKRKYDLGLKTKEIEFETKGIETAKENSQISKQFLHNNSEDKEIEKEDSNSYDITSSSDYYSNGSLTELSTDLSHETSTENSFNHIEENIKPLTNSTFICQTETCGNETNDFHSALSTSFNTQENQQTKSANYTFLLQNGIKANTTRKYPAYKPQNFQIPLIIINEIEIIDNSTNINEIETKHIKTLKVPIIARRSGYEENKDLQNKLNERELYKQIEIKDKVMLHLLQIALCIDFPKLKHFCHEECEKNEKGLCKKQFKLTTDEIKKQEESSGILNILWSAIKYPFVANPTKVEKEEEEGKGEFVKKNAKEEIEQKDNEVGDVKGDHKKEEWVDSGKDKENLEKLEPEGASETQKAVKEKMEENNNAKELNNKTKQVIKILEEKGIKTDNTKELNDQTIDLTEKENKTNINLKDLKEPTKNLIDIIKSNDIVQKENENRMELMIHKTENSYTNPCTKQESFKHQPQEDKKKVKTKKRFLFFFHKSEKTKKDDNHKIDKNSEESITEDPNKIENMEDIWEELEQAETKISEEALKKLESFLADNKLLNTDKKERNKRSGSF